GGAERFCGNDSVCLARPVFHPENRHGDPADQCGWNDNVFSVWLRAAGTAASGKDNTAAGGKGSATHERKTQSQRQRGCPAGKTDRSERRGTGNAARKAL